MRRYEIRDAYRLYECILCIGLIVVLIFSNYYIHKQYKTNLHDNVFTKEQLEFMKNWNGIPDEIEEWIKNPDKARIKKNTYDLLEGFTVTAYDLSIQSCGKKKTSRGYGVTRNGYNLKGHTWETARVIAVDPSVIPLGSKVYIQFTNEKYKSYNGIYKAEDTGKLIKGNKIDLFIEDIGEKVSKKALDFGVTEANIIILKQGGM